MKITRKTNVFVKTVRKFIVHRQETDETVFCDRCNEEMISAQEAANFFGVSRRRIYRSIESEKIHFAETAHNEIYVCLISIKQILNSAE